LDTITLIPDHIDFHAVCVFITENVKKPASQNKTPSKEMQPDVIPKPLATQARSSHCVTVVYYHCFPWNILIYQSISMSSRGAPGPLGTQIGDCGHTVFSKFSEKCYFHLTLFFLMFKAIFSSCFLYNCCSVSLFLLCLIKDNFVHWLGEADTNCGRKQWGK